MRGRLWNFTVEILHALHYVQKRSVHARISSVEPQIPMKFLIINPQHYIDSAYVYGMPYETIVICVRKPANRDKFVKKATSPIRHSSG